MSFYVAFIDGNFYLRPDKKKKNLSIGVTNNSARWLTKSIEIWFGQIETFSPKNFFKFASERDCYMKASRLVIFWSYSEGEALTTTSNCCLNLELVISMTVSFGLV